MIRTIQVAYEFITAARPSTVWRILADVEHWPDWTPTVVEIKPLSSRGLMVGARYRVVQPKLRPAVYEVTECVPNKAFTWVQRLAGGTMVADHRLLARGDATQVELATRLRGASNQRAKQKLGFAPRKLEWLAKANAALGAHSA
jgi:uncharacterized protein YndB with AHSA1/START domain